jgi:hypothetical protein
MIETCECSVDYKKNKKGRDDQGGSSCLFFTFEDIVFLYVL